MQESSWDVKLTVMTLELCGTTSFQNREELG